MPWATAINGQHYYFNLTFQSKYKVNASELDVAVQLDGNSTQTPYLIWVDKMMLTYW